MALPLEHDYIGLSDVSDKFVCGEVENLRETELRLGLPGSLSPERKDKVGLALGLHILKGFASGAKRGFSDAIDGNGKWVFNGNGGTDGEIEKGGMLFSPRAAGGGGGQMAGAAKDVAGKSVIAQEKKGQGMPAAKAQVVGWPPIRSYRKNTMATNPTKSKEDEDAKLGFGCLYVKVSMDGAPYLRKVDLRTYFSYKELSSALEKMFSGFTIGQCGGAQGIPNRDGLTESCLMDFLNGSEYVLTYEDKDGDWMLVGDVPWKMFIDSCKRLRIMKGSDAIGLAPKAMEKNKNRN